MCASLKYSVDKHQSRSWVRKEKGGRGDGWNRRKQNLKTKVIVNHSTLTLTLFCLIFKFLFLVFLIFLVFWFLFFLFLTYGSFPKFHFTTITTITTTTMLVRNCMVMLVRICVIAWLCSYEYALLHGYARENIRYCMGMLVRIWVIAWLCSREYALLHVYILE